MKGSLYRGALVCLFFLCCVRAYPRWETSVSAGLGYDLCLEQTGDPVLDVHSVDMVFNNYTAFAFPLNPSLRAGFFARTDLMRPNSLFPETSNYVIYDFSLRAALLLGPFANFSWGKEKRFEIRFGAGLQFLGTFISHNESSAYSGDIHYERIALTIDAGLETAFRFRFGRRKNWALDLGGVFVWNFSRYMSYKSKFSDYSGFTDNYRMIEVRPSIMIGYSWGRKNESN